ncbi:MAG TPA: hypothetical protein VF912_04525 [Anaeromyxobacter sp.]
MKLEPKIIALVAALAAGPAVAHEKGDRAMGVVESVTPDRIVITASDGHAVAFAVTSETRFFLGDKPVRAQDVRRGQRAVVHGKRSGDTRTAVRVKLGAPPK